MKKKDNMPESMENSEVLIKHSASITGFDSRNYCRLKYTGRLSKCPFSHKNIQFNMQVVILKVQRYLRKSFLLKKLIFFTENKNFSSSFAVFSLVSYFPIDESSRDNPRPEKQMSH